MIYYYFFSLGVKAENLIILTCLKLKRRYGSALLKCTGEATRTAEAKADRRSGLAVGASFPGSLSTKGRDSGGRDPALPHLQPGVGGRQPAESGFPREARTPKNSPLWVCGRRREAVPLPPRAGEQAERPLGPRRGRRRAGERCQSALHQPGAGSAEPPLRQG